MRPWRSAQYPPVFSFPDDDDEQVPSSAGTASHPQADNPEQDAELGDLLRSSELDEVLGDDVYFE